MIRCPECEQQVDAEDFNESTGSAYCRNCKKAFQPGETADPGPAPRGVKIYDNGECEVLACSCYSHIVWLFLPGTMVLSFVAIFFFHEFRTRGEMQMFIFMMIPMGISLLLSLFCTLLLFFGKSELRFKGSGWEIFRGIGSFGFRDEIDPADIRKIDRKASLLRVNGIPVDIVYLQTERKTWKFCYAMNFRKIDFIIRFLRMKQKGRRR